MPYNLAIPGQISEAQLMAIERVATLAPPGGAVVEVGALFGRSSWAWARSVDPSVTVFCIDPWRNNAGVRSMEIQYGVTYGLDQFQAFTADCPNIRPIQGYSPADVADWSIPVHIYYEDAVHADPILSRNIAFWTSRLAQGGVVCGDDYRPRFPDVRAAAERLAAEMGRELIVVDFFWCLLPSEVERPGADAVATALRALAAKEDAKRLASGPLIRIGPLGAIAPVMAGGAASVRVRAWNDGGVAWTSPPDETGNRAGVRIGARVLDASGAVASETRAVLATATLEPDRPVEMDLKIQTSGLAPGEWRLAFDMVEPDGSWRTAAPTPSAVLRIDAPIRRPLIARDGPQAELTAAAFADSHGAFATHLGAGILYYALGQMVRSQISVCIGSGGGFVPSLMRRAQLDAGLDPSTTILIDANLPDLGFGSPVQAGGWMTAESEFLAREHDIEVLRMLSLDAARLLAGESVRIDHLHIDGDHSTDGVRADFAAYWPLMSETGVVTFHDLRMPGVDAALTAILKERPELEFIAFREIGAGVGVLRRPLPRDTPRRPQNLAEFVDRERGTAISPLRASTAAAASQEKARFERWRYLTAPAYQMRYTLAAAFVDEPDGCVVEIGGFPNSIAGYLSQARIVHAVEPYAPEEHQAQVRTAADARGVAVMFHPLRQARFPLDAAALQPFNAVFLGLDVTAGARTVEEIEQSLADVAVVLAAARRVVVEIPGYAPSIATWEGLCALLTPTIVSDITLDLSRDPAADAFHVKDSRATRRLIFIEGSCRFDPGDPRTQPLMRLAAERIHGLMRRNADPGDPTYRLGEEVSFHAGGEAGRYVREGWAASELRHRWMLGETSHLVLSINPEDIGDQHAEMILTLGVKPFVVAGKLPTQRLTVTVNGNEIGTCVLSEQGVVDFRFPARFLLERAPARIRLIHPDFACPADLVEGSADRKPLSVGLTTMTLHPSGGAFNCPRSD